MTKVEIVKDFADLSLEFYNAAKDVNCIGKQGSAPRWYMYRHSLELAIKAAILQVSMDEKKPSLKIEIYRKDKRIFTLEQVHSIKDLLVAYFVYEHSLFSTNDGTKVKMTALAERVDSVDRNSTFFRYPYAEKEKGKIKANKHYSEILLDDSGKFPELKPNMRTLLLIPMDGGEPSIIRTRNKKIEIVQNALEKLIEFIFPIINLTA
jgi:hypothetical protein